MHEARFFFAKSDEKLVQDSRANVAKHLAGREAGSQECIKTTRGDNSLGGRAEDDPFEATIGLPQRGFRSQEFGLQETDS